MRRRIDVVRNEGPSAETQYPHVDLDADGLHHAWTTVAKGRYLYWDIDYARSPTRGESWVKADGTPLPLPLGPDEYGSADPLILPDEFSVQTQLTSMIAKEGRVHFTYYARGPVNREHYVRIDLRAGRIDRNVYPIWKEDQVSIGGLDGFFATRKSDPKSPLVYVGWAGANRIGALVSHDNGGTWQDLALSDPLPDAVYAVGGYREITPDGCVIGSFTNPRGTKGDPYFFKIQLD